METQHQAHELKMIFDNFLDSVLMVNLGDEILYANPPARRLLCRLPDHQGYLPPVLRILDGRHEMVNLRDVAGSEFYLEIKCQHIIWQDNHVKMLTLCDRTRLMLHQRELEQLVYRDELTGLYNRRGMDIEVKRLRARANDLQTKLLVLFIDVNGLKQINDRLGHTIGDAALLETAEVIREGFGEHAIQVRIGGDEFAVFMLENVCRPIEQFVEKVKHHLDHINSQAGRAYRLSLSIGMSQYSPGQVFDFKRLLNQADQNMYRAKVETDVVPDNTHLQRTTGLRLTALQSGHNTDTGNLYA